MRMIDADALIESIKGWYCKDCDSYNGVRCRACGTDDAMSAIDSAPTVTDWISVADRLPDKYGSYLTLREGQLMPPRTRMAVHFWTGNKDGNYWRGAEAGSRIVGITHWMPLPEPPKEVVEDD